MKCSNNSSGKISIQVDIDESLIIDKSTFFSQNKDKVFSLQEFMNLFRKQITRDVIQTFQKELNEEINQRTSVICEMIPDDVWKRVFQLCAYQNYISEIFQLKQVCKRWESWFSSAIGEVKIEKAITLERITSFKSLRSLVIDTDIEITNEIFTKIFLSLNSLTINFEMAVTSQASLEMAGQMTNLTSLNLYDGLYRDGDNLFINEKTLPLLANLEYLALGPVNCLNPLDCLKKLTRLTELDLSMVVYSRDEIESKFGPNLNIIEDLKKLKRVSLHHGDFLNINALQKQYSHVQFRWYIESEGDIFEQNIYEGSFSDNLMNGKGKIVFGNSGNIYEGAFKNDKIEGRGIMYYSQELCRYEGDWKNGMKEGMGTFFSPGGRYEGEFKNDIRDGKGKFNCRAYGDRYEGEFKNDKIQGKGVKYWSNGDRFQGEWKNISICFGTMYYSNGCYYTGDFLSESKSREGQGVMFYSNGNRYEGCFEENKRVGNGIFHFFNSNDEKAVEGDESKFSLNDENGTIELL